MNQSFSTGSLIVTIFMVVSGCAAQAPVSPDSAERDSETWIRREYLVPCVPSDLAIVIRRAGPDEDIDAPTSVYLRFDRAEVTGVAVIEEIPADPSRHPNTEFSPTIAFGLAPRAIERLREDLISSARQGFSGHERHDITMNGKIRRLGCGLMHPPAPASATVGIACPAFDTTFEALSEWVHEWLG